MNPPPGPWRPNPVLIERAPRPPKRLLCRLFGCRWEPERLIPEDDPRWDRTLWRCGRCGDQRKVWIGYRGIGKPDSFYEQYDRTIAPSERPGDTPHSTP